MPYREEEVSVWFGLQLNQGGNLIVARFDTGNERYCPSVVVVVVVVVAAAAAGSSSSSSSSSSGGSS